MRCSWLPALAIVVGVAGAVPAAGQSYPRTPAPPSQLGGGGDPARAALEARLLGLEEEIRRLTGRIEELEHEQGRTLSRLERLVGDVDARLSSVESQPPSTGAAATAPETEAPSSRPAPPVVAAAPTVVRPASSPNAQTRQPAPDVEPDSAAAKGYVLGTIPRGAAVPGAPRPSDPATPPSGPVVAARPPAASGDVGYDGALGLLQAGRWAEAEQAFRGFVERNPQDPRVSSAAYWLAETYFFRKDYPNAAATFARNYRTYGPEAAKAPDNLLKLGMSLAAMGDRDKACQTFGELGKRHANAPAPVRQTLTRERAAAGCA